MPLITLKELEESVPAFRGRAGNAIAERLMHILSIDRINDLYDRNSHMMGPDFAGAVLRDIGVEYSVKNREVLDSLGDGPFITVSNHPYGSIDGVILADLFGHRYGGYRIIVNRFLSRIRALEDCFICVTPTGTERTAPTSDSLLGIREAIRNVRSGHPIGIFPSGAVSDLKVSEGHIRDREWQEPVIRLIRKLEVPVVPVKFLDRNSDFYYLLGLISWKVRILRLPYEVFNKRGRPCRLVIGNIITPEMQRNFEDTGMFRDFLRDSVYRLK